MRTDFSRPWNPGDVLKFGPDSDPWNAPKPVQSRLGEFFLYDEYDPRRTIMFNADGSVWKTGAPPITRQYFLNLVDNEGPLVNGAIAFAPNGTPTAFAQRNTDGNDAVFGDLGNDWIVGGTGRDHIYGGWGNDLMNADDVRSTNNWLNDQPETHPMYEDRVFGGAGLDILIGNTGGDRLIDWVGEFNTYLVPFAPFGIATVSRQVPPQLFDFLYAQAFSDGVDITRTADTGSINGDDNYSNVHMFMGGVEGEIGLITQKDHGFWQDQTGGPTDPQAGNIPGGKRDVLRTADFNDGNAKVVAVDEGNFAVSSGKLTVQSATPGIGSRGSLSRRLYADLLRDRGDLDDRQADGRLESQLLHHLRLSFADGFQICRHQYLERPDRDGLPRRQRLASVGQVQQAGAAQGEPGLRCSARSQRHDRDLDCGRRELVQLHLRAAHRRWPAGGAEQGPRRRR
ncbi:hypothetical protein AJ88_20765 [Mesorhizobium amorphae CCBAU 01583]|nr:hypothetical protein AJ88_20765 [Mesorhizobium amorphae CCBAU 01583]